jgi:hypothetical protein
MKRLTMLIAAAALGLTVGLSDHAQAQNTSNFNCAMLANSPYMCIKNESPAPILAIQAVPPGGGWFNPAAWISIPGGGIMPGGAAVVKFPAWSKGCVQTVVMKTADGQTHYSWNTNVCSSTSLVVGSPGHW